jgi:hypothetical protein
MHERVAQIMLCAGLRYGMIQVPPPHFSYE